MTKKYQEYKESNVDWIKEIPKNWSLATIRSCTFDSSKNIPVESIKSKLWYYYDIPTVQETGEGKTESGNNIDSNKTTILGGEILISKLNPRKGTVILTEVNDLPIICSTEFVVFNSNKVNRKYLYYILSSDVIADVLNALVKSVTKSHQRVNPKEIQNLLVPIPPKSEQKKIVSFLDTKLTYITGAISKSLMMIKLLEEKRQAIITEVITKGLNPNVKVKDSGVEWIGEIPEHWGVSKIKYQSFININTLGNQTDEHLEIKYIDIGGVNSKGELESVENYIFKVAPSRARRIVQKGDTIVSTVRTYLKAIAFIEKEEVNLICSTGFAVLTPKKTIYEKYLYYLMRTTNYVDEIVSRSVGVSYPAINSNTIGDLECLLPPLSEQMQICHKIEQGLNNIDQVHLNIKHQIQKLQEYRQSLIYEAVTGKIDVRDYEVVQ